MIKIYLNYLYIFLTKCIVYIYLYPCNVYNFKNYTTMIKFSINILFYKIK